MESQLIETIRHINPAGSDGFEGLIAELLAKLTGRRFQLAKSGSQFGRDISARHEGANVVAIECKRYGKDTELNERELQAGLIQATMSFPDLDLWVLVASRDIPSQLHETLHRQAQYQSIEFLAISTDDGEPSTLEALCAQSPNTVIKHIETGISAGVQKEIEGQLREISAHLNFAGAIAQLKQVFLSPFIGYDNWRSSQNSWLDGCLASENDSRAHFSQPLNVGEPAAGLVPRKSAWAEIEEWFNSWEKTQTAFVMLGEEGDGKTWAVASWLYTRIQQQEDFPAVVFLSSQKVESNELYSLLSETISRRLSRRDSDKWRERLDRWIETPRGNTPRLLLVLDGINERRSATWWRHLIEQLAGSPWCGSVAVIITCRTTYWQRQFAALRHLQTHTYTLPPYDDQELSIALAYRGLWPTDIASELLTLVRKPRYFDLMLQYREHMTETGDVTVARLIYVDWRDRLQRKSIGLDDQAFETLLKELASTYTNGQNYIRAHELDALLPFYQDKQAIVEELRTGGILKAEGNHFRVDENRLIHGFGLLLVDQLKAENRIDEQSFEEAIAAWLEPQAGIDVKAQICEFAALHALNQPDLPTSAKIALLEAWVRSHNPGKGIAENFVAYYPIDPSCYLEFAEVIWSDAHENPWAQEQLMDALLRWRDLPDVDLASTFERWLGFVHSHSLPFLRRETKDSEVKLHQEICDRVGYDLVPGPFTFAGRQMTIIEDDGLLRLGRTALAIISHLPRGPYVHAIATGCVAEAIMGYPAKYELFRWVMSTSPQSLWPEVRKEVEQLLDTTHLVTQQAVHRLLSFEGSKAAYELQQTFEGELFPPNPLHKLHIQDPCTSGFGWSSSECEICLQREDINAGQLARHSQSHCLNPDLSPPKDFGIRIASLVEDIDPASLWSSLGPTEENLAFDDYEPCLCAYAPESMANLVRAVADQASQREGISLRQLALRLREHYLVLQDEDKDAIQHAWKQLLEDAPHWNKTQKEAEMFLFKLVLRGLDTSRQLKHLLERPETALDLVDYEASFLPATDWETIWNELGDLGDLKRTQRVMWFLSANPSELPADCLPDRLLPFMSHADSLVRSHVLKIVYYAQDKVLVCALLESEWAWDSAFCDLENHWGSLILCEHGNMLPYSEIRCRVHPSYLGYAIRCRGTSEEELNQYALDIHHLWSRIGKEIPDLPPDFPPTDLGASKDLREQTRISLSPSLYSRSMNFASRESTWGGAEGDLKNAFRSLGNRREWDRELQELVQIVNEAIDQQIKAGNHWFAKSFSTDMLDQILDKQPDLVSQWIERALLDTDDTRRHICLARSFYSALCSMLLKHQPTTGADLYWRLCDIGGMVTVRDARSQIRLLDYALFDAQATDDIRETWKCRLELCTTDLELMQIATMAQYGDGRDWLRAYIKQRIGSAAPLDRCRAFTLLGFVDAEASSENLLKLLKVEPIDWVKRLLTTSLNRWKTNVWAKHWYRRFLDADDKVAAWAAFRLFLRCADSRFWFWQQMVQPERADYAKRMKLRLRYLDDSLNTIENRIRKNERPLGECLFGQKIQRGQAWPWM